MNQIKQNKIDFIFYSVPNTKKVSGGSRTRIKNVILTLENHFNSYVIEGNSINKLKKIIRSPKAKVLYVESASNRLKLIDVLNLLILAFFVDRKIIYIRDVYVEVFPEEYNTIRKKVTALLNKWSYCFYAYYGTELCFPTIEMSNVFKKKHKEFPKKELFAFPPCTTFKSSSSTKTTVTNNKQNNVISFLYLGGTKYAKSGFEDYLKLSRKLGDKYKFYFISNDKLEFELKDNISYYYDMSHNSVLDFINANNITFAIHTRPRNIYDDITFPIKFLDFLSCRLPILTLKHTPLTTILPNNYPFYLTNVNEQEIERVLSLTKNDPNIYGHVVEMFSEIIKELNYKNKFNEIINKF